MTFEERLAQTQAKLEDVKAKINESIDSAKAAYEADKKEALIKVAKMDAAIEDFGRDVEAQVYCDVSSIKAETKADVDAMGEALDQLGDKIDARAEKAGEALDKIDDKIDAAIGEKAAEYDVAAEKVQAAVDDGLATVEGDVNAAEENIRIAKERYQGKLNATRLKVQMHLEELKAKIEAKKTAIDKAAQEELIMDLLDYADDCQMIAYAYAMEAELAILDACEEIEDYESKYGKKEEA